MGLIAHAVIHASHSVGKQVTHPTLADNRMDIGLQGRSICDFVGHISYCALRGLNYFVGSSKSQYICSFLPTYLKETGFCSSPSLVCLPSE